MKIVITVATLLIILQASIYTSWSVRAIDLTHTTNYGDYVEPSSPSIPYFSDYRKNANAHPVCNVNLEGKQREPEKRAKAGTKPKTREDGIVFATDNRQHFRDQFEAVDFTFNVFKKMEAGKAGEGGRGTIVTVADVPALKDEGVAMVYFELEPCGLILPHAHPRATELIFAVDAEKLQVGVLEETNSRFIVNEISTGQMQNVGCKKLVLVGFFNHENPGSWFATQRLFDAPIGVVAAALDIDEHLANELRNGLPLASPVKGRASCLKKCELPHDYYQDKYSNLQQQEPDKQMEERQPKTMFRRSMKSDYERDV